MLTGLQILHGCKPNLRACSTVISSETFFTIRQVAKWYFAPEGVLYTVCDRQIKARDNSNAIEIRRRIFKGKMFFADAVEIRLFAIVLCGKLGL